MTHEEFDKLVAKVEQGIGRDSKGLRKRLLWLAVMGYVGLLAPLGVVLGLGLVFILPGIFGGADAIGFLVMGTLILAGGFWAVGRTLWVRLPAPEGCALGRSQAPALFAMLDELRLGLRSIPFDVLIIVPDHNAAVMPLPRLGVFGWPRNYLLVGLPLLESLTVDEFRSVLAHEFAHLSKRHGRFSQWIYRLRRSWEPVFAKLSKPYSKTEAPLRPVVSKFLGWFWPQFNAHAFVLSRRQEYEADATAAQLTNLQSAAMALARTGVHGRALEQKFWPEVWQQASSPVPPGDVFVRLSHYLTEFPAEDQEKFLGQALRTVTTNADTHPSLSDRLGALGAWGKGEGARFELVPAAKPSAAEALLGPTLEMVRADVQKLWAKRCETTWPANYSKKQALNDRLGQLQGQSKQDVDALWDRAQVVGQVQGQEAAVPLLREILSAEPRHVAANFQLGCLLLGLGQPEGEQLLERALAENEELLPRAADALHAHFRSTGQGERIRELHGRMDHFERTVKASHLERSNVSAADTFVAHELTEEHLAEARKVLEADLEVIEAEVAQKQLRYFVRQRLYILCIRIRPAWHHFPNADREQAAINRIAKAVRLPGRVLVITPSGSFRQIARKLRKLPGAAVFRRG